MNKSLISCVAVPRLPSSPIAPLLVNCRASRLQRLRLFHALVTASFRWSLCVLSVKQGVLQRLRVHCVHSAGLVAGRSCSLCLVRGGMLASVTAQCEALGPHLQWTMGHFACCQCLAMDWSCAPHALDLSHPLRPSWLAPFLRAEAKPRWTWQQRSS